MTGKYKEERCAKCDDLIMVMSHDVSAHFYCQSCAWAKFGGVSENQTVPSGGLAV